MLGLYATGLVLVLATTIFLYFRSKFSYWQRRKVPGPTPRVPFGNFHDTVLGRKSIGMAVDDLYQQYKSERYIGTYFLATPLLHIHDPEIIRHVFIKEFQDFNGRGMQCDPENDPLSGHLFILSGTPWRNMRVKLSPTFTTGKIKFMFNTIRECAEFLTEHIDNTLKNNDGSFVEDVRELVARFSTDVISSVAFGIESNSMKDPDSEFRRMGQRAIGPSVDTGIRTLLAFFCRDFMSFFKIRTSPGDVHDFFMRIVKETVQYREKNNVERADMLNLLIQLKNKGFVPPDSDTVGKADIADAQLEKITENQMAAQVFVFFIAGFETTSTTTSFTLFELAKNPEVQEKVIREIEEVLKKHNGQVTYEAIMDLPYTGMVLQETMRMYPPVPFLTREAMVRRDLPLTDLIVDKGTRLMIPVQSLHMDPQYWPEPHKYDPMRFTEEAKKSRPSTVYLPFGDGPRLCIGMRFGLVQAKMGLVTILSRCRVSLVPGTPRELPLSPLCIIPTPLDGVKLTLSKL